MAKDLSKKKCLPCEGGIAAIPPEKAPDYLKNLPGWTLLSSRSIEKEWVMKDFVAAIQFIRSIAKIAEAEGHHPDLHLTGYRNLKIELSTHAIGGLSENDFILAAKIEKLPKKLKSSKKLS